MYIALPDLSLIYPSFTSVAVAAAAAVAAADIAVLVALLAAVVPAPASLPVILYSIPLPSYYPPHPLRFLSHLPSPSPAPTLVCHPTNPSPPYPPAQSPAAT